MKCQICKANEATIHFKQIVNGEAREIMVCEDCAMDSGFDVQSPLSMTDFLFGMDVNDSTEGDEESESIDCPICRMSLADFRKESRLGCDACYDAFVRELEPFMRGFHKGMRHTGKVPARERVSAEVLSLQKALNDAVDRQDFEEAAKLRDAISDIRKRYVVGSEVNGETGQG